MRFNPFLRHAKAKSVARTFRQQLPAFSTEGATGTCTRTSTRSHQSPQPTSEGPLKPFSRVPNVGFPTEVSSVSNMHWINQRHHQEVGPIYAQKIGPDNHVVYVADPQLAEKIERCSGPHPRRKIPEPWCEYNRRRQVERGLLFLDGEQWLDWRKRLNRVLMRRGPAEVCPASRAVTQALLDKWIGAGQTVDAKADVDRWSVECALAKLFGPDHAVLDLDVMALVRSVHVLFEETARLQVLSSRAEADAGTPGWRRLERATDDSLGIVSEAVCRFGRSGRGWASQNMVGEMSRLGFGDDEIGRIVADLILAAADTTSITTAWTLHLLACHEEQQDITVWQQDPNHAGRCVRESMRLYPVAPFLTRMLAEPIELAGYEVPADQLLLISIFAMGRDARYFPEPLRFWPQRWQRASGSGDDGGDNKTTTTTTTTRLGVTEGGRYASMPFGHGIRACIGKLLAGNQMAHLLNELIVQRQCRMTSLNREPVNMTMRMTGGPDRPIEIGFGPK